MRRFITFFLASFFVAFLVIACVADTTEECDMQKHVSTVPNQTIRVYKIIIHAEVPGSKIGPIIDAASEWTTVTDGKFVFEVVYDDFDTAKPPALGEMRIYIGPKKDPKSTIIGTARWWGTDVYGRPARSIIWIEDDLADRMHYLTTMHEIGHALGLKHAESKGSIMYPLIMDNGDHVPCIDRESICKIWSCKPEC